MIKKNRIYKFACPKCNTEATGFIESQFQTEKCLNCGHRYRRFKNKLCELK